MKISKQLNHATKSMGDNSLIATLMTLSTLLVALSIVLSRLWIGDIKFSNRVIERKNQANTTLEANVAALPALSQNFQTLVANGPAPKDVLRALPTSDEFADFGKELEAVASLAGSQLTAVVKVGDQSATALTGVPTPTAMAVEVTVVGGYLNLVKFVGMLEQTARPVRVDHLVFSGAEPSVTLNLGLTTWWQAPTIVGNDKEQIKEQP